MKELLFRRLCVWLLAALGCVWTVTYLTACNTVEGAGEDIEEAGEEIEDAAD